MTDRDELHAELAAALFRSRALQAAMAFGVPKDAWEKCRQAIADDLVPLLVEANAAADALTEALRLTVEYVGTDVLPPEPGWSWWDALVTFRPETAALFE